MSYYLQKMLRDIVLYYNVVLCIILYLKINVHYVTLIAINEMVINKTNAQNV